MILLRVCVYACDHNAMFNFSFQYTVLLYHFLWYEAVCVSVSEKEWTSFTSASGNLTCNLTPSFPDNVTVLLDVGQHVMLTNLSNKVSVSSHTDQSLQIDQREITWLAEGQVTFSCAFSRDNAQLICNTS